MSEVMKGMNDDVLLRFKEISLENGLGSSNSIQ